MRPADRATEYARSHPQQVRVCWLDRKTTLCAAAEAVALCADRGVSGRIVGAVADDKRLEDMLNRLLDDE